MKPRTAYLAHVLLCFISIVCAIHFEAGSVYHYSYITDLSLNEANEQNYNGAHRPVGFRVSADLKLTVVWKKSYDYLLKLEITKSTLHSVSREGTSSDFKELRKYPVYFHWHGDGTVGRVYIPMAESTISANIKKGIVSMLQLQTVDGERTEVDASGECKVEYSVVGNKVTKTKNSCVSLEKSGSFKQANQMLDSGKMSTTITTFEFANDVVTSAESTDSQIVILNADKKIDIHAKARQVLKLKETTKDGTTVSGSSVDNAVAAADPGNKLDMVGMMLGTDIDSPTCLIDCSPLADAVNEYRDDLSADKVSKIESPQAVSKLLPLFRQASKEKIKQVLLNNADIQEQLLDIAAAAQTDYSIEAAMEILDFNSASYYQKAERFIMAASFATHPRESLITALYKLFTTDLPSKELSESLALSIGAVTRTFCQVEDQCSRPIVKDIERALVDRLINAKDIDATLLAVRAMRNARLQATKPSLIKVAEESKESAVSNAAVQALAAINKDFPSASVVESMNRIYHQTKRTFDSSVRSAALSIILSSGPSVQQIKNIIISTVNQTDTHLAMYVLGTMQDLANLNPAFREKFVKALAGSQLKNYNTWSPGGKANALTSFLGRSQFTDIPYRLFMQNAQTGIMKKSGMQVNLQSLEHEQPLLLFSIYAQGLESLVDSKAIPEGAEPEDPTAGLSLDLLDVLLRPVQFFKGSSELMSAVWNAPSEPVSALAMNVLLQDKRESLYLQNGLVVHHEILGVASIQLSGFISISLWNQDAHSVIRDSGAAVVNGGLSLANNNYLNAAVSYDIQGAAYVDFTTDVNFYVTPPQVCLRMALDPFTITENWTKSEQGKGIPKKVIYRLNRTQSVPGASYLMSEENSRQCTKLLEK